MSMFLSKSRPHRRFGGFLVAVVTACSVPVLYATAEEKAPSSQTIIEFANSQKAIAQAQSAALKTEADNFSPGNIRFYDKNQLDEKGNPKQGAIPRLLIDDEFDAKLDEASRGRIHLWYISGGFALNAKAEKIPEGTIIKLIGPLLAAARENRKETLVVNEQKEKTRAAPHVQRGVAANGDVDALTADIQKSVLEPISKAFREAYEETKQEETKNRTHPPVRLERISAQLVRSDLAQDQLIAARARGLEVDRFTVSGMKFDPTALSDRQRDRIGQYYAHNPTAKQDIMNAIGGLIREKGQNVPLSDKAMELFMEIGSDLAPAITLTGVGTKDGHTINQIKAAPLMFPFIN